MSIPFAQATSAFPSSSCATAASNPAICCIGTATRRIPALRKSPISAEIDTLSGNATPASRFAFCRVRRISAA